MAIIGPRDTTSLVLPVGWDAAALEALRLADGTTYAQVVVEASAAIGALNAEINGDGLWSSLVSYTTDPTVEYRVGVSNGFEVHTEFGRPDQKRADMTGHMIPLLPYDRMLGWTWDYLRKARLVQVRADIADAIKDARDLYRKAILKRLIAAADDTGATKGLGAAGISPGFAHTAASTGVDFIPPAYGGTTFVNTHDHYVAAAGGAFTTTIVDSAKSTVREHGHEPPYDMIIGTADETAVRALTGFVPIASAGVAYASTTSLAELSGVADSSGGYFIGIYSDVRIRVVRGVPQYYGFLWKSYGANSPRNPLAVRVAPGESGFRIQAMPDPNTSGQTPLQNLMLFTELGVGVADRTNGTARYVNNASWADGSAT